MLFLGEECTSWFVGERSIANEGERFCVGRGGDIGVGVKVGPACLLCGRAELLGRISSSEIWCL